MTEWAAGTAPPPAWVNALVFAERFGVPPHTVGDSPAVWLRRSQAWEHTKAQNGARAAVERYGLGKVSDDARKLYNDLILSLKNDNPHHD